MNGASALPGRRFVIAIAAAIVVSALVGTVFVGCERRDKAPDLVPSVAATVDSPRIDLQDGDRVVWLGDSITHQALFSQYLETYFVTRYPERDIRFFNRGIAGDAAADVLARFERDVAALEPTHVVVQLGMNDGGYRKYRPEIGEAFENHMVELLERIEEVGALAVLISPTFYDVEAEWRDQARDGEPIGYDDPALLGYDAVLERFRAITRRLADDRQLPYADVRRPIVESTRRGRIADPSFSLVPDSLHPSAQGHALIALTILSEAVAPPPSLAVVRLAPVLADDRRVLKWVTHSENAEMAGLVAGEGPNGQASTVSFQLSPEAAPWVMEAATDSAGALLKIGHVNREILQIADREPGAYVLRIDDFIVGTFSAEELHASIDLAQVKETPQSLQAQHVAELNRRRNEEKLRSIQDWWVDHRNRLAAIAAASDADEKAQLQADYDEWLPVFEQATTDLEAEAAALWEKMRVAAQPRERHYELRRLDDGFDPLGEKPVP